MTMRRPARLQNAQVTNTRTTLERPASKETGPLYVLRLYVSGASPTSLQAIGNIKSICAEVLEGRYDLEVVGLYQAPARAAADQIMATPTLVKKAPPPSTRLIGKFSNAGDVSKALGIPHVNGNPPGPHGAERS